MTRPMPPALLARLEAALAMDEWLWQRAEEARNNRRKAQGADR